MITLKEAFKLCRIEDREIVHFRDRMENEQTPGFLVTGKGVKEKYDMKNTLVTAILPRFCCGEFGGFTFITRKKLQEKREPMRNED